MSDVKVYAIGLVSLSVCAPEDMPPEEVVAEVNTWHPTGISTGWKLSEEPAFATGHPNPVPVRAGARPHPLPTAMLSEMEPMSTDGKPLLGVRAVARRLGVHENTVRNWTDAGFIHAAEVLQPSGFRRYAEEEVERVKDLVDAGVRPVPVSWLLWTTRNGQRQWSGPYSPPERAHAEAANNHHCREMGYRVITGTADVVRKAPVGPDEGWLPMSTLHDPADRYYSER